MGCEELRDDGQESKEVTGVGGDTDDASILGPVHLGNSSRAFLNIYSVLRFLDPGVARIELDGALRSDGNLVDVLVDLDLLNWSHGWSESFQLFSKGTWVH